MLTTAQTLNEPSIRRNTGRKDQALYDERRQKVLYLKHEKPTRTLQSIGTVVGLSRERVRQILKETGLVKYYPTDAMRAQRSQTYRNCIHCDADIPSGTFARKTGKCPTCSETRKFEKKFQTHTCSYCNGLFVISKRAYYWRQKRKEEYAKKVNSKYYNPGVTCSRKCSAKQLGMGIRYGWGSSSHLKYTDEMGEFIYNLQKQDLYNKREIVDMLADKYDVHIHTSTMLKWSMKWSNVTITSNTI